MRQPAIKLPVGCKIYPQNILGIFYGLARLIYTLDLLSILPTTLIGTLLVRNSSSMLWPWLYQ